MLLISFKIDFMTNVKKKVPRFLKLKHNGSVLSV